MPGIVGILSSAPPAECQRLVGAMLETMMYERTYVSGTHFAPDIGAYGGWVAHDESPAARLSRESSGNGVALLLSGECFRPGLAGDGASLAGHRVALVGDDSVFRLYDQKGDLFVRELEGLFSGLLIDRRKKRALLFNDRYGCERIYHFEKDGATYFASEAKALLRILPELRAFDDQGVAQYLTYGCTLEGRTLFRNVRFLPGGSLWVFDAPGEVARRRYFQPQEWESQSPLTEDAFEVAYLETFDRILPRFLNGGSKVGISLTGGLDTRMIMARISASDIRPVCYTFAGVSGDTLDVRLAAQVAKSLGLEHHTLRIGNDFLSDFGRHVDRTAFVTDGCAGALVAHEVYLNAQARRLAPVRLTGNYGSEILRGMSTFKPLGLSAAIFDTDFRRLVDEAAKGVLPGDPHPVTHAAFCEIPWLHFGTLAAGRSQLIFRTPYLDGELVRLAYRAPAGARQSPRAALRLIHESEPALGRIPTDRGMVYGERGLRRAMRRAFAEVTFKLDYLHKEGLPDWLAPLDPIIDSLSRVRLLGLHKFLPYRTWFRRELANYVTEALADPVTKSIPYWNTRSLPAILGEHVGGKRNYIKEIGVLLTLTAVQRTLIGGEGQAP